MWIYSQRTGLLFHRATEAGVASIFATGYSGHGEGVNNPDLQNVAGVGPLPQGQYQIEAPFDSPNTGPYALRLTPLPGTETFGRSDFEMHGDLVGHEGEHLASHGCLIFARTVRETVWQSGDHLLTVVADVQS